MTGNESKLISYPKKNHSCHYYLERVYRPFDHTSEVDGGFFFPRLAYMIKGECTVYTADGETLEVKENSVWFIPKFKPYKAIWRQNNGVEFYVVEFDSDFLSESYLNFDVINNSNTMPLFDKLFKSRINNDSISELKYLYAILDEILPFLKKDDAKNTDSILPALNYLNENFTLSIKVNDLAKMCFMSKSTFYQTFKKVTNTSPIEYKNAIKLSVAKTMICDGLTLEQICDKLNFASPAFLRRLIKKYYKKTPKELKKELPSV